MNHVTVDWTLENAAVANNGERMTVYNGFDYWAHLSIYRFAIPFARGRRVLDVGSGSGYGAAYLAACGAREVLALDVDTGAIAHSKRRYSAHPVTYKIADLNQPLSVADRTYDVVFSSNVFEHVSNIDGLTRECSRGVTQNGVVIIAVPPVLSSTVLIEDIRNHFHVNHLPPSAWAAKLRRFFDDVQCHGHKGAGEFASQERIQAELALSATDAATIREIDFEFPALSIEELQRDGSNITVVFVCSKPRSVPEPETIAERSPESWHEGAAAARILAEERALSARLRTEITALEGRNEQSQTEVAAALAERGEAHRALGAAMERIAAEKSQRLALAAELNALKNSRSWRATAPLRALATRLRGRPRHVDR